MQTKVVNVRSHPRRLSNNRSKHEPWEYDARGKLIKVFPYDVMDSEGHRIVSEHTTEAGAIRSAKKMALRHGRQFVINPRRENGCLIRVEPARSR